MLYGTLALPLLLLASRGLRRVEDERWRWSVDGPLALLSGLLAAWSSWRLVPFYLVGGSVTASDFGEYCETVFAAATGASEGWSPNRSHLTAAAIGWLARQLDGPLDGMLVGAWLSVGLIGLSLYVWGRALHGRVAGILAALLTANIASIVILGRTLSFYPEVIAGFVVCSATVAVALRWRTPWALALAGAGTGLALLVDVRGLLWALPALGLGLLAVAVGGWERRSLRRVLVLLVAFVLPLLASWWIGHDFAWSDQTAPLEAQADIRRMYRDRGYSSPQLMGREHPADSFIWGHSDPRHIPETLRFLRRLSHTVPAEALADPSVQRLARQRVWPWRVPAAIALLLTLWGLRRRPVLWLGLLGTVLPYAVVLQGAMLYQNSQARFLANALPPLPLLLGVAAAVLSQGALPSPAFSEPLEPRRPAPLTLALAFALGIGVAHGGLPTLASPAAPWRGHYHPGLFDMHAYVEAVRTGQPGRLPLRPRCQRAVELELAAGSPRFFPLDLGEPSVKKKQRPSRPPAP